MKKSAIVLGASGLIGACVLDYLLADKTYEEVNVFVRRPLPIAHSKLKQHIVDFDNLDTTVGFGSAEVLFSCLGTTIKKAGSQAAFTKVDFEYPLAFANIAKQNGIKKIFLVSAVGATSSTSNFYLKTKGDLEIALAQIGFESLGVFRPSFLLGDRTEFRLAEVILKPIMQLVSGLLMGSLSKYKAIQARDVAKAMLKQAEKNMKGLTVLHYKEMMRLASEER
jgi:uncharacterized protein YbjT (DUF2867 family)